MGRVGRVGAGDGGDAVGPAREARLDQDETDSARCLDRSAAQPAGTGGGPSLTAPPGSRQRLPTDMVVLRWRRAPGLTGRVAATATGATRTSTGLPRFEDQVSTPREH